MQFIDVIIGILGKVISPINSFFTETFSGFGDILLLIICLIGGYFYIGWFPKKSDTIKWFILGLIFFILIKFAGS